MPNAFFGLQVPSSNSLAVARVLLAISGRPEAHIDHKPPKASILGTWKAKLPWMPRHTPMALAGWTIPKTDQVQVKKAKIKTEAAEETQEE